MQYLIRTTPFIDGRFVPKSKLKLSRIVCPRTERVLAEVGIASSSHVDDAVLSARDAHNLVRKVRGSEMRDALLHISDLIAKHRSDFVYLESLSGKLREDSESDVASSIEVFRYFAGHADKLTSEKYNVDSSFHRYTQREPIGVCGLITSFNYPLCKPFAFSLM